MLILRRGSERDHGLKTVSLGDSTFAWASDNKSVLMVSRNVPDFTTPGHHDWHVFISLSEFTRMTRAVAEGLAGPGAEEVLSSLTPELKSFFAICAKLSTEVVAKLEGGRESAA